MGREVEEIFISDLLNRDGMVDDMRANVKRID
jgi:hypothetical protein